MDDADIPALQYHVERVVRHASRPGGPLDRGEFTMKQARRAISEALGLAAEGLDEPKWKNIVKALVQEALDSLPSASSPVRPLKDSNPAPLRMKSAAARDGPADMISVTSSPSRTNDVEVIDIVSESEMSSVYDEPSKQGKGGKKRKSDVTAIRDESDSTKIKKAKGLEPKKTKSKSAVDALSSDETRVAELKKIVVACGVRKQWTKELADCHTATSQVRHLLRLLETLGMKGQPTMGKANALKIKRELAAEIEDVVAFEAERGLGGARRKRASTGTPKAPIEVVSDDDDGFEVDEPKSKSAGQAVFDFCGQASDSE